MRYVSEQKQTRDPSAWWQTPYGALPHPQAVQSEPVDTGLLDASGRRILRLPDQIGFIRPRK